jgi:hypothetical protein
MGWTLSDAIPYADDWQEHAMRAIDAADVFAFLATPSSINSSACEFEWRYAASQRKPILRIDLDDVPVAAVPDELVNVTAISTSSDEAEEAAEVIGEALSRLIES